MKTNKRFIISTVVLVAAYVLSACGGAPQQADQSSDEQAGLKVRASVVAYTGVVEAIDGSVWTVNGQFLTIDPAVIQDGPFQVGDTIKVEGDVNPDGSLTVTRIEQPSASDLTELPTLGDTATDDNSNDANNNDDNANENDNDNDNDSNDNSNNDDDSNSNDNDDDDDDDGSNSNSNSNDDDEDDDDEDDDDDDDDGDDD